VSDVKFMVRLPPHLHARLKAQTEEIAKAAPGAMKGTGSGGRARPVSMNDLILAAINFFFASGQYLRYTDAQLTVLGFGTGTPQAIHTGKKEIT
jgi:hypothetical protein